MDKETNKIEPEEAGMAIYEEIVNNVDTCKDKLNQLIYDLNRVDISGQFLCSTARFLAAVDREEYEEYLPTIVEYAIDKDRERKYIGQLLQAIWGEDYMDHADELKETDDLFRRVYKRVYATGLFD